jgi:thymidylate synthase
MHLKFRNVNDAFHDLVEGIYSGGIPTIRVNTRNGEALVVNEPVLITYSHPTERVLFNPMRDAPCFFSLYEALWMLAGRNDVAPLAYYCKQMSEYSDDGKTLNGAYGHRWRMFWDYDVCERSGDGPIDQLQLLISHLRAYPSSRRAVLSMWNVEDDLLKIGPKHSAIAQAAGLDYSRDVCCNLNVMFSLREERGSQGSRGRRVTDNGWESLLDMTVTNRSNDLTWGLLGTNYVHFSILQEYMAAHLGVRVGVYNHFTNNLHVYLDPKKWQPEAWLAREEMTEHVGGTYPKNSSLFPLVQNPSVFDKELPAFVEHHSRLPMNEQGYLQEPFLENVAKPMLYAYHAHKQRNHPIVGKASAALCDAWLSKIQADDWRVAAMEWVNRRVQKGAAK